MKRKLVSAIGKPAERNIRQQAPGVDQVEDKPVGGGQRDRLSARADLEVCMQLGKVRDDKLGDAPRTVGPLRHAQGEKRYQRHVGGSGGAVVHLDRQHVVAEAEE